MSHSDSEFEALLDKLEEEFSSVEEEDTPPDKHVWDSERTAIYGNDHQAYRCKKCFVRLQVGLNESINAAIARTVEVLPSCSEQLLKDVAAL